MCTHIYTCMNIHIRCFAHQFDIPSTKLSPILSLCLHPHVRTPAWSSDHAHMPQTPCFQLLYLTFLSTPPHQVLLASAMPCSNLPLPEGVLKASHRPSLSLRGSCLDSSHCFPREDAQPIILHTEPRCIHLHFPCATPRMWQLLHVFWSFKQIQCNHSKPRTCETMDEI